MLATTTSSSNNSFFLHALIYFASNHPTSLLSGASDMFPLILSTNKIMFLKCIPVVSCVLVIDVLFFHLLYFEFTWLLPYISRVHFNIRSSVLPTLEVLMTFKTFFLFPVNCKIISLVFTLALKLKQSQ